MSGTQGSQGENRSSWLVATSGALGPWGKLKLCKWVWDLEEERQLQRVKGHLWSGRHGFGHDVENHEASTPVVSNLDSGLPETVEGSA